MNTAFKTLLKLQERIYQTTRDLIGYEQERNKEGGGYCEATFISVIN